MKRLALTMTLAALAVASVVFAEPAKFSFDPAHSEVGFTIRHLFSKVPGRFTEFDGALMFDEKNIPASSVTFTIQAKSINTGNDRRDNHLRSADFFDVEKFPTLTFTSSKVSGVKDGKFTVAGDLTMHGITKPVTLECEFLGAGDLGMMGYRAGFDARTVVDRKEFGILWNKTLDQGGTMLGDDVAIVIHAETVKQAAAAPAK
jgi:polyisoprenoid-binding protein YceI